MARPKSEFLSGFSIAVQCFKAITDAVLKRGGDDSHIRRLLTEEQLADKVAQLLIGEEKLQPLVLKIYPTVVDCTVSDDPVERFRMMRDAGNHDWMSDMVKDDYMGHWSIKEEERHERELVLVHLNYTASSEDALRYMREYDLKRPTIADGLAFGTQHPELQRQFPIIVLSEQIPVFDGRRRVLVLYGSGYNRDLYVYCFGDGWSGDCRFLACK